MKFAYISGRDSTKRRRRIIDMFKAGQIDVLIASTILDEGFDAPCMETLILAGGGKAAHRQIQRLGRVMRAWPGKDRALVFDFADEGHYLGEHSRNRVRAYLDEPSFNVQYISDAEFAELFK